MRFICVIPAREKSRRFPRKLLAEINGQKIITKVVENCAKSLAEEVIVATDSLHIKKVVDKFVENKKKEGKTWAEKIRSEIVKGKGIKSGTDRVARYISMYEKRSGKKERRIIVNVQGDEPFITPGIINKTVMTMEEDKEAEISTYGFISEDKKEIMNPNRVKIVVSPFGYAVYFSRSPVPHGGTKYIIHTGIYVFRPEALMKFACLKPTKNEKTEKLEQLRAIDNGMKIKVVIGITKTISVDTKEDLEKIKSVQKTSKTRREKKKK